MGKIANVTRVADEIEGCPDWGVPYTHGQMRGVEADPPVGEVPDAEELRLRFELVVYEIEMEAERAGDQETAHNLRGILKMARKPVRMGLPCCACAGRGLRE